MSETPWEKLQDLFHQALPLDAGARAQLLDRECAAQPELRAELERLLGANDRAGAFIRAPAVTFPGGPAPDLSAEGRRIGAYRLTRPVGRGGMGAVYLAERDDGAYIQRVAIKLIKRGMDTDQVLARFRAERQILASLDHPNIARLLDGGTSDDGLPYFAMEYIEGQPIDAFAEAMNLGVEERLRLFLQVCDAVAYAHAHDVIHRDIKPLNTLVTQAGVPKLLDFGIAKVLHDSPDEITATVTGLRLLTPEYASPEQIEGKRATVASDVYSLGVVLYELLTGRSPYRLTSRAPQEVAAAVVTTEPDRPSTAVTRPANAAGFRRSSGPVVQQASEAAARQLSRRLRGDLDTIVLTALRKEPGRRYTTVADMAADLRRHLEGKPIAARGDDLLYRAGKFVRRNRTAAAVAFTGLAAAALVLFLVRNRETEATLLSVQALSLRDRILVADFVDRTGDTTLTAAITEALRTDLSQSSVIRVMTPRQVRAQLQLMIQSPDVALDDSLARELALREGVKAFVTGSVATLSGIWTLNVQLVAAQSGEALASIRETAEDSAGIIMAVDRASKQLRRQIGESLKDLAETPAVYQATTASLAALRYYTEGQRLVRQGKRTQAVDLFEKAVSLDTAFASAYVGLAMLYGSMADPGRSEEAGQRALDHRDRLPYVERSFLIASRAHGRADYETAIRTYTDLVARYPENLAAINNLALAYRDSKQFAIAESLFRRAFTVDSSVANVLFGLHSSQVLGGRFAEAAATLDTIELRFPGHPVLQVEKLQDAAAQQDWPRAEQVAWTTIEKMAGDTFQLVDPYEALGAIAMTRGRLREAEQLWKTQLRLSRASGVMARHINGVQQLAWLRITYYHDTAGAIAFVDSALKATPLDSLLPGDRPYGSLAMLYLAAGKRDRFRGLIEAAERNDSILKRQPPDSGAWGKGAIAFMDGKYQAAIDLLLHAVEKTTCTNCVYPDLARAYDAAGRPAEAAEAYERYVTTPWLWRYEYDATELGPALKRLAELYEQLGKRTEARMAWERLIALWDRADPELQPIVQAARARVAALK
ncbi:MAG TPA: protein kinase [Gemmatimonadales bacterium]|nr:protein kinase [Gemmatimonadales bacterium]